MMRWREYMAILTFSTMRLRVNTCSSIQFQPFCRRTSSSYNFYPS